MPITDFDNRGFAEVYLYDASRREVTCVSCDPAGQRPAGSRPRANAGLVEPNLGGPYQDDVPTFSGDGSRLIFRSRDQLVAEDVNDRNDVYEYVAGRVRLLSGGRSAQDANPLSISDEGATVMFSTYDSLVPEDRDHGDQDIYVVRRSGGFASPAPSSPAPECTGDPCQGSPVSPPTPIVPRSNGPGAGEQPAPKRVAKASADAITLPDMAGRRSAARTGKVRLVLTVTGAGRVGVRTDARVGGAVRIVGTASTTVRNATKRRVALTVVLTAAACRQLSRTGRLSRRSRRSSTASWQPSQPSD